jgi:signal peptidase I
MSNDPAAPDNSEGQPQPPAGATQDSPDTSDAVLAPRTPPELASAPSFSPAYPPRIETSAPVVEGPAPEPDPIDDAAAPPPVFATQPVPPPISVWPPVEPVDPYIDVPVSLELAYTDADIGLSDRAYDRAYPYEVIQKKRRRTAGTRARKVGRELAETVILALLIFFAVKAVVQNFRVEGASMEPSMHNNEYLLVNKALYFRTDLGRLHDFLPFIPGGDDEEHHLFRAPRRGDVIVFKFPLDPSRDFIKRVIGVPGDTVEVRDETVFINGSPLSEDYIKDKPNYTYAPKTVPPGMYYVLGDNRRNSFDSHAWGNSCSPQQLCDFVPEENIIGQAWVSYWPFDQLGFINNKIIKPQAP